MYLNSGNSELIRCLDAQGEPRWAASSGAAAELHPPGRGQAEIRATHMGHSGRGGGRRRGLRGGAGRGGAGRGEAAVAIRCEVAQALRRCSRRSTSMESVARRKAE